METLNLHVYHKIRLQLKNLEKRLAKDKIFLIHCKKNNTDQMNEAHIDFIETKNKYIKMEKEYEKIAKEYLNNVKNGRYIYDVKYDYDNICEDVYLNSDKEKYFNDYNIFKYHFHDYNYQFDSYDIEYNWKDPDRDKKRRS